MMYLIKFWNKSKKEKMVVHTEVVETESMFKSNILIKATEQALQKGFVFNKRKHSEPTFHEVEPLVSLSNCVPGQYLVSKHGMVLTYSKPLPAESYYDHEVFYPDGYPGSRIDDGHVYRQVNKRFPADHDIIGVVKI